jgi:limonene-1,2-epoxide hydrolase
MAESGAVEALLDLLRSHQCEEAAARLIEALLNNIRIREAKAAKNAIAPLSMYLLDPQTQSQQGRLLAALALGDLFQNEGLARSTDAVAACRALVNLLEDQPTEEMKVVAICALQNLVMYSRANKRAVAESGGVQVLLDLISSSNPDTSVQAAMFVKLLFNNHTIQEYATSETVRVITGKTISLPLCFTACFCFSTQDILVLFYPKNVVYLFTWRYFVYLMMVFCMQLQSRRIYGHLGVLTRSILKHLTLYLATSLA